MSQSINYIQIFILLMNIHAMKMISMTPEQYRQLIMNKCYNRTEYREPLILGQKKPVGMSIDYFVTLVQKIENHFPHLDAKQIAAIILKRFHYDGIRNLGYEEYFQQVRYPQMQQENEVYRRKINEMLFNNKINDLPSFAEEIFNEDEKCAMYFMVSHTVNRTAIDNYGNHIVKEFGIVSVMNDDKFALSLNYVLLAIAVAMYDLPSISFVQGNDRLEIDPLFAVTISDKLAISSIESIEAYDSLIGSTGVWNSTYCQSEFLLIDRNNRHVVTMAEINGAIDGWMIGSKLLSQKGQFFRKMKLSTIIDRYYSHDGLSIDCGICKVDLFPEYFVDDIYRSAKGYAFYWNKNFLHENIEYERIDGFLNQMASPFLQFIQLSNRNKHEECSRITKFRRINMEIETKNDVYIMIDNNAHEYSKYQLEFITKLLIKLKSLDSLGRITIMVNARQGYDSEHISNSGQDLRSSLHILAYNTTSIQKATCRLAWYNYRETTINNKKDLLFNLLNFLERDNQINAMNGHSKNFIWFSLKSNSYERLSERDRSYYYQYRWNLLYYLNVRMFFISTYDEHLDDDLSQMIINKGDWFGVNAMNYADETIVDKIVQRTLQTPLPMRFENFCQNQNNHTTIIEKFLIGKSRKQYWVLYPKYFLDARSVHFKFESTLSKRRICLGRYLFPETNYTQCRESDGIIEFTIAYPCRWKVIESCLPIYFTVISKEDFNVDKNDNQINKCYYSYTNGEFVEDVCTSRNDQLHQLSIDGLKCSMNHSFVSKPLFLLNFIMYLSWILCFYL